MNWSGELCTCECISVCGVGMMMREGVAGYFPSYEWTREINNKMILELKHKVQIFATTHTVFHSSGAIISPWITIKCDPHTSIPYLTLFFPLMVTSQSIILRGPSIVARSGEKWFLTCQVSIVSTAIYTTCNKFFISGYNVVHMGKHLYTFKMYVGGNHSAIRHTLTWTKWLPFRRRHFPMHFDMKTEFNSSLIKFWSGESYWQ